MKLKKLPQFRERNHLALHPLLHKGGVHQEDDIDTARMRERRATRQKLKRTDWLKASDE
jgi:hypothetical protein